MEQVRQPERGQFRILISFSSMADLFCQFLKDHNISLLVDFSGNMLIFAVA